MQKKYLVLVVYLGGMLLSGCSSKPDVGDVEAEIKEFWKPCKLVNPTSFKKTNGVDRGDSYQMAISYKLEIVKDIAVEDIWGTKVPEEISPNISNGFSRSEQEEELKKNRELNAPRLAATTHIDNFYAENCPMSLYFQKVVNEKYGMPLKNGETFDMSPEFTMVKSENGWISQ